jgi:OOP family OmpA-OmpF porin
MRPRIARFVFALALLVAMMAEGRARADCTGILSPCIDDDILWPHAGPSRFVWIGAAQTVAPRQLAFGLVSTYLSRPVVLHTSSPGGGGTDQAAIDNQVNGSFLWAYGVTERLELDFAFPITYYQDGAGVAPITGGNTLKNSAIRDLRFGFSYALLRHERVAPGDPRANGPGVVGRLDVVAPSGDHTQLAGERSGVFEPNVAGDWRFGRFYAAGELGLRLRPATQLLGARVGTQIVTALGVGFDVLPRELLSAQLEAWALPTTDQQADVTLAGNVYSSTPNGQFIVPAEWQLSVRTAPIHAGDFSILAGGGGGIPLTNEGSITTPRFRFTLGVRWAPEGRENAGEPTTSPSPTAPPPAASSAVDLRLASAKDVCTDEPDLVDGFKDTDGCPDEDQDKDGIDDRLDKCPLVPEDFQGLTDGCPEKKP